MASCTAAMGLSTSLAPALPQVQQCDGLVRQGSVAVVRKGSNCVNKNRVVTMSASPSSSSASADSVVVRATALALLASSVLPEIAEAAPVITPSLKNLLLSVAAGFFVLTVILVAVAGVASFDPIKRQ